MFKKERHIFEIIGYKRIIFVFVLFISFVSFGQGEGANWYFGNNAGIKFDAYSTNFLSDGILKTNEGCATISSSKGDLLFYTDGIIVWDKNHNKMPNGQDLLGNPSSTQSAIIVPKPNSETIYYIFTVINGGRSEGLRYSEVDLTLNNGNGDVTSNKNILLLTPCTEKISAIKHANGKDYWVSTHNWNSSDFTTFKVTDTGIDITPKISSTGSYHGGNGLNGIGYMKFSPNGKKLAIAKWNTNSIVEIFDFDSNTGSISNPITLDLFGDDSQNGAYGVEFSPNSNLLYVSGIDLIDYSSKLYQFDLSVFTKTDIINSETILHEGRDLISAIQLALDGKIYISRTFTSYLSTIENPNSIGVSSNYIREALFLGKGRCVYGLPTFIQSLFVANIEVDNLCLESNTQFKVNTNETIDSIIWDFGDSEFSSLKQPDHVFKTPGEYTVEAKINTGYSIINIKKSIVIKEPVTAYQPDNMYLCDDESNDGKSFFNLKSQKAKILNGQTGKVTFHKILNEASVGVDPLPENYENQTNPEKIYVRVESLENPSCYDTTYFFIEVESKPIIDINEIWYLCPGEDLNLYVNSIHDAYSWSTGETSPEITVKTPGDYNITVYNTNNISCGTSKTIKVIKSDFIENVEIKVNDLNYNSNSITIQVEGNGEYEYSIDEGYNYQFNNHFDNLLSGDYIVYVRDKNGCVVYSEEVYVLSYPKFFTPNNDGYNDYWKIEFSEKEPDLKVDIFDRYGKLIIQVNALSKGWDGTFNGQLLTTSDYWFVISRPVKNKQYRGHFTLKR